MLRWIFCLVLAIVLTGLNGFSLFSGLFCVGILLLAGHAWAEFVAAKGTEAQEMKGTKTRPTDLR